MLCILLSSTFYYLRIFAKKYGQNHFCDNTNLDLVCSKTNKHDILLENEC